MKQIILNLVIYLMFIFKVIAQDVISTANKSYPFQNIFEFNIAVGASQMCQSNSWTIFKELDKKKNFRIGFGLRESMYFGFGDINYYTAPAKHTSGEEGPQVIFKDNIISNIDTIKVHNPTVGMCNIHAVIQYTFFKKLDLGFNIDLVGFSFGAKTNNQYRPNLAVSGNNRSIEASNPTIFNLLLVSDNDLGSLNSEFYARYWINQKWAVKAMYTFMFTEYTTTNKLRLDNDRFRNKSSMIGLGISCCIFR
ncbi:MAG: hypothetical protein SFY32_06150 [Bacteroidota bacterium]|nr:hypothetical protein [Bacteroidota bacterium]